MGLCGEIAHRRLGELDGNASYRNYIIDAAYHLDGETLERCANYEIARHRPPISLACARNSASGKSFSRS